MTDELDKRYDKWTKAYALVESWKQQGMTDEDFCNIIAGIRAYSNVIIPNWFLMEHVNANLKASGNETLTETEWEEFKTWGEKYCFADATSQAVTKYVQDWREDDWAGPNGERHLLP